ncbi:MAG: M3 family metallopeptidase [Muribaculaceae bacterium]|jgi:peptidyl-dipeptidase Dcp|nr:M3 family metallopeptidase [Muribaculaceae bacterium]MEE1337809.1 M3 family metallopeptidase [Muribaculaceae bacterium]
MNKTLLTVASAIAVTLSACNSNKMEENPFLADYTTQYEIPPFDQIKYEHYLPAVKAGIEAQNQEIDVIIKNRALPDFENTILALDNSGQLLNKVAYVFFALSESDNTPEMEALTPEISALYTAHSDNMGMNEALFARIKEVYDNKEKFNLNTAQTRLLEKYYKNFVRSGALLDAAQKDSLKAINQELSKAFIAYNENVLKGTNAWELVVENKEELAGLPEGTIATAADEAKARGKEGKWVFTLHAPSRLAVLTYAENRELREKMWKGYTSLASEGEFANAENINAILKLRTKKANMLGFDCFADYAIDNVMAKTTKNAEDLLYKIWKPAVAKVKEEVADMQAYVKAEGKDFKVAPWDYYYYAEKVKAQKFNISEDDVRPYFKLENVVEGLFHVANKLYGVTFTEMKDAPKYNPEVTVYEVKDAAGEHLAVFMTDYFPRATKRQGAWMSEFKGACNYDTINERPVVYNVGNFTRPSGDMPALLTIDEVETAFHEFGHGLHGMLTRAAYRGQAGTNVDRDLVELPSQITEHWAFEPEVLAVYAKHYQTGETIPAELVEKLIASSKFNQGFATTELAGAALLDIEWHKVNDGKDVNVAEFEAAVAEKLGLPEELTFRYRSTYFKHIFGSDGYAAGYYTYLWAEVLDADGFELFAEKGIFDKATADAFRINILEAGGSEDPMTLYKQFRGQEPNPDALLRNRGLK